MSNLERQENTTTGVVLFEPVYEQNVLEHGVAETLVAGTVLARNSSTGKLNPYVDGGPNETGIPKAVLQNEVEHDGATDVAINAIVGGQVRRSKLNALGVGALTQAEVDELRDYGIVARSSQELSEFDN